MRLFLFTVALVFPLTAQQAARTTYYLVEGTMTIPSGRNVGGSVSVIKRTVDPAKERIEERVLYLRGSDKARELVTIFKPQGSKAVLTWETGEPLGDGVLEGPAWQWTRIKFTTHVGEPKQVVEGEDLYTENGMSAEKRVLGPDGKPQVLIHETGRVISEQTYGLLAAALLPR